MEHFTCPHGHRWETPGDGTGGRRYCPICGSPHLTVQITGLGSGSLSPQGTPATGAGNPSVAIPDCELLGELGRGGMGVVYKARQTTANRLVAVKMILAGAYAGPVQVQRFRTEAEAAARLDHPNIVKLYAIGEQEGRPYFLLEYVNGSSLAQQLDGTPWPARQAASLTRVLAEAIHVAHRWGIVHRDLKPGNVLLTEEGVPKIADFGLAKILDQTAGLTQSGDLLGTPCYIAPEQADRKNRPITPAVDVYALGAILYELLTGRPPFKGETPLDTVLQVLNDEPVPVSRLQPKVPPEVETICMKCLEKEPRRRYGSAKELADELGRFLKHEPIQARPMGLLSRGVRWCKRYPSLAATGGLALLLLQATVVLSVWFALATREQAGHLQEALSQSKRLIAQQYFTQGRTLCEQGDPASGMLWMGRALKQAPLDEALDQTLRINLRTWGETLHPLVAVQSISSGVRHAQFLPAHNRLITADWGADLWTWDDKTQQWRSTPLLTEASVDALTVSANGATAATLREGHLVEVWDTLTGKRRGPPLKRPQPVSLLALSPSGEQLLLDDAGEKAHLWDIKTGTITGTLSHPRGILTALFSPEGQQLFTVDRDGTGLVWGLDEQKVLARLSPQDGPFLATVFHPRNSKILATGSQGGAVQIWEIPNPKPVRTVQHGQAVRALAWSAEGDRLFTASDDRTARGWDLATGEPLWEPLQHRGPVHRLVLGKLLADFRIEIALIRVQAGLPVGVGHKEIADVLASHMVHVRGANLTATLH